MADTGIEARLIGLMLVDPANIRRAICTGITSSDYRYPPHREIHAAIIDAAIDNNGQVDAVTLAERLHYKNRLDAIGGAAYIGQLVASVHPSDHIANLARQLGF